jgi:hypothetical protein
MDCFVLNGSIALSFFMIKARLQALHALRAVIASDRLCLARQVQGCIKQRIGVSIKRVTAPGVHLALSSPDGTAS